ncbi:hypothetical protein [Pararhizobium mangrovi]|uniref:Surface antigen n=1 Tax=Pararhizobium mangrovi TaxID=2590452 RepID=A0A506UHI8_9HYPH|nr:hypothetical protein [Pararhizobium mangrovi]TPW32771.1 hypothetical protein FJU11_00665 [Pararhizobium mangrovi]
MKNNRIFAVCTMATLASLAGCSMSGPSGSAPAPQASASVSQYAGGDTGGGLLSRLNGGIIGQQIGSKLPSGDRTRALKAEYNALEDAPGGQPVTWQDPSQAISGKVVAAPPYQVGSQNCRQYTHTVTIRGQEEKARGAACRNGDGSWTPLS